MTTARDDLKEVNAALRELVRLQLARELPAQEAWQARRQMLDSVEAAWHDLSQDLTPEALASKQVLQTAVSSRLSWRQRLQQRPKLQMSVFRQFLLKAFTRLPWWSLFLLAALATFYYVSTL